MPTNWFLPIKLDTQKLLIAQALPKRIFAVCQILTQFACFLFEIQIVSQHADPFLKSPLPPFSKGGKFRLALMPLKGEGV